MMHVKFDQTRCCQGSNHEICSCFHLEKFVFWTSWYLFWTSRHIVRCSKEFRARDGWSFHRNSTWISVFRFRVLTWNCGQTMDSIPQFCRFLRWQRLFIPARQCLLFKQRLFWAILEIGLWRKQEEGHNLPHSLTRSLTQPCQPAEIELWNQKFLGRIKAFACLCETHRLSRVSSNFWDFEIQGQETVAASCPFPTWWLNGCGWMLAYVLPR